MIAFAAAYLTVWLAVTIYVVRLGAGQRRLERELEILQSRPAIPDRSEEPASDAA